MPTPPAEPRRRRTLPVLGRLNEEVIARAVHEALQSVRDEVAEQAYELYEQALAQVEGKIPPSRERACAVGCVYCCHLKVTALPAEVLGVAAALGRLDADQLAAVRERVSRTSRRIRGMTAAERAMARVPCPLLDAQGACVAYEVRPLACRGANAYVLKQCKAGFESDADEPIEHYGLQRRTASAVQAGAAAAAFEQGLDGRLLELVAALQIALEDPSAAARHRRGEPVFEAALDPELTVGDRSRAGP